MKKNLLRDLLILFALVVVAFLAKMEAINGIIAIGIGIWAMVRLFKPFFKSRDEQVQLELYDFIRPINYQVGYLLLGYKRKLIALVILWWILGIGIVVAIYEILTGLFIFN